MITVRQAGQRGHANHGWLDSHHTFSFGNYHDPAHMGFRHLRVINEDQVAPGAGFPTHSHRDMEIISYVIDGALAHKDSMGNGSTIRHGDIQRMSAGRGVSHSEFNESGTEPVHFLQIWIETEHNGIAPGYEQVRFADTLQPNEIQLIATRGGGNGTIHINQDASIWTLQLEKGGETEWQLQVEPDPDTVSQRYGWVQVVRGSVIADDVALNAGDGAAIADQDIVKLRADSDAELLLFSLA